MQPSRKRPVPSIYISYSRVDQEIAAEVKALVNKLGFEQVFFDLDESHGIAPGADWERKLYENLARSHAVILVLTPNWVASKWCFVELTQARALGKAILPIIAKPLGDRFVLPDLQAIAVDAWTEDGTARLRRALESIGADVTAGFRLDPH